MSNSSPHLSISKHATPEHSPQFGIYPGDGDSHDIAIVRGEHAQAYATLFAAAPELLAALQEIVVNLADANEDRDESGELFADIKRAHAAIAKALAE